MTAPRDELREDLLAVIAAAPELSEDEREHLADVFLDQLDAEYRLVPRGAPVTERSAESMMGRGSAFSLLRLWPIAFGVMGLFVLTSLLVMSAFVVIHPPIFLFVILLFFILRSRGWRPRRRMYL